MTDTRDPQTEKGQNGATEENLAETAQAPEKTLEEQFREEICPTCTVKAEADETRLRALAEMENFKKRIQRDHDEYMRYASEPRWTALISPFNTAAATKPVKACSPA